jgi:hypothetical protein
MKFKIVRSIPASKLYARVPKHLARYIPSQLAQEGVFTLIIFRDHVVLASVVRKALERLVSTKNEKVLALAEEYTVEAAELLSQRSIPVLAPSAFWLDDRYKAITQGWDNEYLREHRGQQNPTKRPLRSKTRK